MACFLGAGIQTEIKWGWSAGDKKSGHRLHSGLQKKKGGKLRTVDLKIRKEMPFVKDTKTDREAKTSQERRKCSGQGVTPTGFQVNNELVVFGSPEHLLRIQCTTDTAKKSGPEHKLWGNPRRGRKPRDGKP